MALWSSDPDAGMLTAGLAWSMPVDVVTFGAHLETYVKLLPSFTALRLCNRFGKGPEVSITKLPVEMIAAIEELLTQTARAEVLAEWELDFKCFESRCEPVAHLTSDDFARHYDISQESVDECDEECCDTERWMQRACPDIIDHMNEHSEEIENGNNGISNFHDPRVINWMKRTSQIGKYDRNLLQRNEEILRKHFGLEVFIAHSRLDTFPADAYRIKPCRMVPMTTSAHLTLPRTTSVQTWTSVNRYEEPSDYNMHRNGLSYCADVEVPSKPCARMLERFPRALNILGLRPMAGDAKATSQTLQDVEGSDKDEPARSSATAIEPRLMMLAKSTCTYYRRDYVQKGIKAVQAAYRIRGHHRIRA